LTDFNGYNHNQYAAKVDLSSIPDAVNPDEYNQTFAITRPVWSDSVTGSQLDLFGLLINNDGTSSISNCRFGILLKFEKTGEPRYWYMCSFIQSALQCQFYLRTMEWDDLRSKLQSLDIETYSCTAYAVTFTTSSQYYKDGQPSEIDSSKGYTFTLLPQFGSNTPIRSGFVVKTPKNLTRVNIGIYSMIGSSFEVWNSWGTFRQTVFAWGSGKANKMLLEWSGTIDEPEEQESAGEYVYASIDNLIEQGYTKLYVEVDVPGLNYDLSNPHLDGTGNSIEYPMVDGDYSSFEDDLGLATWIYDLSSLQGKGSVSPWISVSWNNPFGDDRRD
jgi:hypothetical protein